MPYEGEHACRLFKPVAGAPTRRVNGEREHNGKKYDVIYQKKDGKWQDQAYRYPTGKWTASSAKSHCKSHKGILFEPAAKSKEKSSLQQKYNCECIKCGYETESEKHCSDLKCPKCGGQMRRKERPGPGKEKNMDEQETIQMQWDGCDTVPAKACNFVLEDSVYFADGEQSGMVKLVGYRGEIINHWFWGQFAVDMKGLSWDKKKTPGLMDHDTNRRLTFSKEKALEPEVYLAGPFLNNPDAQTFKDDMTRGFPFQASMALRPAIIEQVLEGKSVQVNGKTLKGPGAIFRKSKIMEISAVVFGAFSNTESTEYRDGDRQYQFELIEKEIVMAKARETEVLELTVEQVKTEFGEVFNEIMEAGRAEGAKNEKDRFAALKTACGDDSELLVKCFAEGLTTAQAQEKRIEKLSAERDEAQKKVAELKANPQQQPDPAVPEFNNQSESQAGSDEKPKSFMEAVNKYRDENKCSEAEAVEKCADLYPELQEEMRGERK